MKSSLKILITVFVLIFLFTECYPQNNDSLKTGCFYSFTLDNGSVVRGKVMSFDSTIILLKTKSGLSEIKRQSIRNVMKLQQEFITGYFSSYEKPQYKKYISLNTGIISRISMNDEYNYYYNSNELKSGLDLSVAYTGFFSRSVAVRTIASYSYINNEDFQSADIYNNYSMTGGNLSQFIISLDFLAGLFHPEKKINFYVLAGIGIGQMNSSEITESHYYVNADTYTYAYNPESQWLFKYGLGGGATCKVSEKIALQSELIYDHVATDYGYYDNMNQLKVKAGIVFINF